MLLAAATINWNNVQQTIDGFGGSSAWAWGTWSTQTMDYLYSPVTGAGLSLLRSRVAQNVTTSENLIMEQAAAYGARVWSTPWTPPREWKTNHDTANGGELDPAHYQDYANALADYAQDMARQGIPLYALSIQNEPNWTADYESCRWNAQQFANFLPYLGQTFTARGITTKIMLPEQLNWGFDLANIIMADPSLAQYVGILSAHNYGESANSWKPCTIAGGRSVWETEISSGVQSDLGSAIDTADDIHQAMTDGQANAYHYWWLNASGNAGLIDNGNATKRMWAMGHYSRFVRPGWVRIGETDDGGLDITTFKDQATGKFAIVVVNTGTNNINETFTLNGVTITSLTPYTTSSTQNIAQGSIITLTGGTSFTSTIAAQSIVTYYGISSTASTLQAPTNLMAAPVQGNMAGQIGLSWSDNSTSESAYTVERSTNGVNWSVLTTTLAANSLTYIDTGRAENTLYYYRVKPTNGDATTYSAVASTSTVMKAPSSVNGTRVSTGINLTWTINSSVSTGVAIDRSLDGLVWTNIANLATRATSYSDAITGYNANQIYYYRVRNTLGSQYSALAGWNTGLAAPTNFAVASVTISSVTVTWTSPLGASGAWIQKYNSSTSSWDNVSPGSLQATDGTYTITGLAGGTSYTFRMRASSDADTVYSSYTSSLNATTRTPSVNPVVWYKADENSGSTLADSSGNGKNATLSGTYSFTAGVNSNAVNLNGGYASLPTGIVSTLGDFTIATWARPSSIDAWSRLFDFGTGQSNYMHFTPKAGSTNLPRFAITTGSGEQLIDSSTALSVNTWTHIAITLSGNVAKLYFNGVVVGTNTSMTLWPSSLGSTTQNYLGKSQFSWDPAFKGAVDDFRIYERALSVSEIGTLANVAPTVAVPAAANPSSVTGTTTNLTVRGADRAGESNLTYTWTTTDTPPADVIFSANGTNAAKNTIATFSKAGSYNFLVTITNGLGLTVTSSVSVTVNQTLTGTNTIISPASTTVTPGGSAQFNVYGIDQFGDPIQTPLNNVTWAVFSGSGTISSSGLYNAPSSGSGIATIRAITSTGQIHNANATLLSETAWYKADESSGSTLADFSGNAKNATLSGATEFGPGISGNALILSGGNASLPAGIVSTLTNFTIATWVKVDTLSTWSRIFDFGTGTSVNMYLTPLSGSNTIRFAITTSGSGAEQQINGSAALTTGSWQHVAVTLSGNTGTLYVNGVAVGSNTNMTLRPSSLGSTTQNYIGKSQYPDPALVGSIDDFRIIGRALSQGEIQKFIYPTIVTAANAGSVTSTSAVLSVLGADATNGESSLTYTWSVVGTPPSPVVFSANASNFAKTTTASFTQPGTYNFLVKATNTAGFSITSSISIVAKSTIVGRKLFYNGSKFDAVSDDNSIAPDKQALLPGGTAAFANYSSYSRGLNGIMIDIQGLSDSAALTAADFQFKVGNDNTPSAWSTAAAPTSITVRHGAGTNGSDRVTITWADNAIQNIWLQVMVKANANTGLLAADVFYFGNVIGESGNDSSNAMVDSLDESLAWNNRTIFSAAQINNTYDYNRDGRVTVADALLARHNSGASLQLISAPSGAPLASQNLQPLTTLAIAPTISSTSENTPQLIPAITPTVETVSAQPALSKVEIESSRLLGALNPNSVVVERVSPLRNDQHKLYDDHNRLSRTALPSKIPTTPNQSRISDAFFALLKFSNPDEKKSTSKKLITSPEIDPLLLNQLAEDQTKYHSLH